MLKRILTAILVVLFFPALSLAQDAAQGDVTIRSDPQGALVTLTGEMIVSGVTPARFRQLLIGKYIVSVERPGYERYTSRAFLDPSRSMEIDVKLTPKTRFKAAVRSLVVPGWGNTTPVRGKRHLPWRF
ncbi:MAG: PEGA domain-containing protein [candidate division Zixibacteria bacterium]|nr:PEGA domain-containing protein [candidate division Zixibacteria bacterium]